MGPQIAARAVALIGLVALLFTGIGFAGFAVYRLLALWLVPAAAAAITAAIFFAPALILIVVAAFRANGKRTTHQSGYAAQDTLAILANLAKEKPLLAVLFAGLMGVAESMTTPKK